MFKVFSDDKDADESKAAGRDQHIVEVKKVKRFSLAVKLIALDDFLRSVSRQLQVIREGSGIDEYGGFSKISISNYVRIICAVFL